MKKKLLFLKFLFLLLISSYSFAQNCTVNANVDQNICATQTLTLIGNSGGLINGTTTWSQLSGPSVIITNPSALTTTVTGIIGGSTYVLKLSAICQDGNSVSDNVSIIVRPITRSNSGVDQAACPGTLNMTANNPGAGETGAWTIVGGNNAGVVINTLSSPTTTLTLPNVSSGTTTLRWVITNVNGCISGDNVLITNYGGVTPVTAGPDQTLSNCYTATQSTTLAGSFGGAALNGQNGTWLQVSGPNYAAIASPNSGGTGISNLVQGAYVFRWTVTGPCATGTDDVTINVPAGTQSVTAVGGTDLVFCTNTATTAVLSGTVPTFSNENVVWTQTDGPAATISNVNSPATLVSGLDGSSTYTFTYTLTNSVTACNSSDGAVTISYFNTAPFITLPADVIGTCNDTTYTIAYTEAGGAATRYSIISGPYTAGDVSATNPQDIVLSQSGTYTLRFERYADGTACGSAFDDMQITVSLQPSASNAGTTQNLACGVVSSALAGNSPLVGTGSWSQISGPNTAIIATPNTPNSNITGLASGTYRFRWIISTSTGCTPRFADVIIRVKGPLVASNATAGPDQNVCGGTTSITLAGNTDFPNTATGLWTVAPAGPVFANANNPTTSVTGLAASTVYTFTWTVSNSCNSVNDNVTVTTSATAGPTLANAGPDNCLAGGTATTALAGNTISSGTGMWSVVSGPNVPSIVTPASPTTTINSLVNGTYILQWSSTVGGCQTTRDTVRLTINPSTSSANAGPDQTVCGTTTNLAGNIPVIGTGTWTQTLGPGENTITTPNFATSTITGLTPGLYRYKWTITNGACAATSADSVVISVTAPPTTSSAGPDQTVCSLTNFNLAANTPTSGTGVWSIIGASPAPPVFANANLATTSVTVSATGTYTFRWSITSGTNCPTSTDDVVVNISLPANAGTDVSVCQQTAVQLTGTDGSTGIWTQITALPSVIVANSPYTATATILPNNTYTYRYTTNSIFGCASTNDNIVVTNSQFGTIPNAGPDQAICLSGGSSITMAGNIIAVGTGSWTLAIGPGSATITTPSSPASSVTGLTTPGLYIFEWNSANGNCSDFADVVRITVDQVPTVANAGADNLNACPTGFSLNANLPAVGIGTWSQVSGPSAAVFDFPNQPTSTVSNTVPGAYVFAWTITSGSVCAPSIDNVSITFPTVAPTTPNAGPDQAVCNLTTTNLAGNTIATGTGTWSIVSSPSVPTFTANNPTTALNGLVAGIYTLLWNATNGGCAFRDTVKIVNSPTPTVANAGPDQNICSVQSPNLAANAPSFGTGMWSQGSGPNTANIIDPTLATTQVVGTLPGTYVFTWSISSGACPPSNDNVTIVIAANCPPIANANNTTTAEETPVVLTNILVNDTDPDGNIDGAGIDLNTVTAGVQTSSTTPQGTWTVDPVTSNVTFTPALNFTGNATLIYQLCDQGTPIFCDTAILTVTVNPVNDPPVANGDFASGTQNVPVTLTNIDGNDTDVETIADQATIDLNTSTSGQQTSATTAQGTWSVNTTTGDVLFSPTLGFSGVATLIYSICDQGLPLPTLCDTSILTVNVLPDSDGDAISNAIDIDDDNDGILDIVELCGTAAVDFSCVGGDPALDADADGVPNFQDPQFCSLNTAGVCANMDADGDGAINNSDLDADNDGISDVVESGGSDPENDGIVGTGVPTDTDGDGLANVVDATPNTGAAGSTGTTPVNTDGNGPANFLDVDSDNDGILDVIENGQGALDTNSDGRIDGVDTDGDGAINVSGVDNNTTYGGSFTAPANLDGDMRANYIDLDADNDGIADVVEGGKSDVDNNGVLDGATTDTDNDGWFNSADPTNGGTPPTIPNSDNNGQANFLDRDSDNDGISDAAEYFAGNTNGINDSDNDGVIDNVTGFGAAGQGTFTDGDNDGWSNLVDGVTITYPVASVFSDNNTSSPSPHDLDNDGKPNYMDIDTDNDGITDNLESAFFIPDGENDGIAGTSGVGLIVDTDGDGLADAFDLMSGFTPAQQALFNQDRDGDGSTNYLDIDADNDGIVDNIEGQTTFGYLAPTGIDTDGDGLDNAYDLTNGGTAAGYVNIDGGSAPDYVDTNTDNDNATDLAENFFVGAEVDLVNNQTLAPGPDGCLDNVVGGDLDFDGLPDIFDLNITIGTTLANSITNVTNNGQNPNSHPDTQQPGGDRDWRDNTDNDGDGIPDGTDIDDDNDGITDINEGAILDGLGLPTNFADLDGDGIPNWEDLDSDNDGITDVTEAGGVDPDGNGIVGTGNFFFSLDAGLAGNPNNLATNPALDLDDDGLLDIVDANTASLNPVLSAGVNPSDFDGDGNDDFLDIDSDNDGLFDVIEFGGIDQNGDGEYGPGISNDIDADGLNDAVDILNNNPVFAGAPGSQTVTFNPITGVGLTQADTDANGVLNFLDTDGDGLPNYHDLDSDNDGIADVIESGGTDPDNNGIIGSGPSAGIADADNDGASDLVDNNDVPVGGTPLSNSDLDGDGKVNALDLDSDNDGLTDLFEASSDEANFITVLDPDNNGIIGTGPSVTITDADGDGWSNVADSDNGGTVLTPLNTDGTAGANYLDIDADNDGIVDNIEWQSTAGYTAPGIADADNDGLLDAYDQQLGGFGDTGNTNVPNNIDGDATADYLDLDTDNDGFYDISEGWDPEGDGIPNTIASGTDSDNDGLDDAYDVNDAASNPANGTTPSSYPNADNTGTPELDWREQTDNDGDGITDINDLDNDNDGITDTEEMCGLGATDFSCLGGSPFGDADGDGTPNFGDADFCTLNTNGLCTSMDTDGDGQIDLYDLDSDNDGIYDLYETGTPVGDLATLDPNGDGIVDGPYGPNGLADVLETVPGTSSVNPIDTDGDGTPDFQDLDSDNDGIFDVQESGNGALDPNNDGIVDGTDTDGDGIINNPAIDSNTSFGGTNGGNLDTDGDGIPNSVDLDADNDGITDLTESGSGAPDSNNDGIVDGVDGDNDGIIDTPQTDTSIGFGGNETPQVDTDNDGIVDFLDLDSDNDGIKDVTESGNGALDPNNDGIINGPDADGDGIMDLADGNDGAFGGPVTPPIDTDSDGVNDYLDLDSDNDGIFDVVESASGATDADNNGIVDGADTDGDGIINDLLIDSNNTFGGTGFPAVDTDGDGNPNYQDLDADNDGITDLVESGTSALDANNDGIVDGTDTDGDGVINDGVVDVIGGNGFGGTGVPTIDTDGDGTPNLVDLDSDNDGIYDLVESGSGAPDTNNDGIIDGILDVDNDGIIDVAGVDDGVGLGGTGSLPNDFDNEGTPNYLDLDADNDGLTDLSESGSGAPDVNNDGIVDGSDTDGDGVINTPQTDTTATFGGTAGDPVNTDGTENGDYLDLDADNDGITDLTESGMGAPDANIDGIVDGTDMDGDGIINTAQTDTNTTFGGTGNAPLDTDGDGHLNSQDLDADNDGITDLLESGSGAVDANNDGVVDGTDTDGDGIINDGIVDPIAGNGYGGTTSTPVNFDNDATPNYLDLDADNDGIYDLAESGSGAPDINNDGVIDGNVDADNDGVLDVAGVDTGTGFGGGVIPINTDGDGKQDYLDLDSDNDGITDLTESGTGAPDATGDGIVDGTDTDGDGIINTPQTDTNTSFGGTANPFVDTDGDGIGNWVDLDSDNDGITDLIESGSNANDANNDGVVDGTDTDNDGIVNTPEIDSNTSVGGTTQAPNDFDGDGVPNYVDLDADNDGIYDVVESGQGAPDTNNDGVVDGTDTDGDGVINTPETDTNSSFGSTGNEPLDSESDSHSNYLDIDADNDGITDLLESGSGAADTDNNGVVDGTDTDGDGIINDSQVDNNSSFGGYAQNPVNTDNNAGENYIDIDSDDDGIPDNLEAQSTGTYTAPSGVDADGNGRDDAYDTNPIIPENTDGDANPDYTDLDSDGDGIPDTLEAWDFDHDGVSDQIFTGTDTDGDGLDDGFENGTAADGWDVNDAEDNGNTDTNNTDGEDQVDYRDLDSDNDGVIDEDEYNETLAGGGDDCDGDGIPNWYDIDVCDPWIPQGFSPDGDGINDFFVIPNIAYYPNNDIIIFNRWGNVVYETKNYQNDWNGTTNVALTPGGEELPTGTYYYVFTGQNEQYPGVLKPTVKKGYVYIQR